MWYPEKREPRTWRRELKATALLLAVVLALLSIAGSLTTYVPRALPDARINNIVLSVVGIGAALLAAFLPPRRRLITFACAGLLFLQTWTMLGWLLAAP